MIHPTATAKLFEEVNRKLCASARNRMVQLSTLNTDHKCHNVQGYRWTETDNITMPTADHTV